VLSDQYDQPLEHILRAPIIFGPSAYDLGFQFLHIDDAARLLISCTTIPVLEGPYNIAGNDVLSLETIADILEKRFIRLPAWVMGLMVSCMSLMVSCMSLMGLLRFGFHDLVRFQLAASTCTQKSDSALGKPVYSSRQALALWRANVPK
jgi:hypothetical protein